MIELVIDARRRSLGGFEVGRVLPFARRRMVGPFIFFDHMGPVGFPAAFRPGSHRPPRTRNAIPPSTTRVALPPGYPERAVYVASGEVEVEIEGQGFGPGRMPVFASGSPAVVTARAPSVLMAIGGDPMS